MANVGTALPGKTLIGTGNGASPTFASIGTNSGLTTNGVVIARGNGAFAATNVGILGQVLTSNGLAVDPSYQTLSALGVVTTLTSNSGVATPSSGNIDIIGRSGAYTDASGSTLTVHSPIYDDVIAGATLARNTGNFCSTAGTYTLPASAGLDDGDLVAITCTVAAPDAIIIQAVGAQKIWVGNIVTSAGGTTTSTDIGDTLMLRFRASEGIWYTTAIIGNWQLA
jgi:hypothetical protein